MAFLHREKVLFRHCDPAGIVFYPRYFEMMNDTVEAFFDQRLNFPFRDMQQACGVPTAAMEATFTAPSRLGDDLVIALTCDRVGRSSLTFSYVATCEQEQRFRAVSTVVYITGSGQSAPWPADLKGRIELEMEGAA